MRVLLVTDALPRLARGGMDLHVREVERSLRRRGIDVMLRPLAGAEHDAVGTGGPPGSRFRRSFAHASMCELFSRLLRTLKPDVVHFQTLRGLHYRMPFLARETGALVAWTHHDLFAICQRLHLHRDDGSPCDGPEGGRRCPDCFSGLQRLLGPALFPLRTSALASALSACHVHVAPSVFVAEKLAEHGVEPFQIHVLPPALARPRRKATPPPADEAPRLVFAGDLRREKGADLAAAAVDGLQGAVRLDIHGGSPAPPAQRDASFEASVRRRARTGRIALHGRYQPSELRGFLDGATAMLVPSRVRETFGRTANEALLAGVPVVVAAHGALPEQVAEGVNGALFEPGDVRSLTAAIDRVVAATDRLRGRGARWPRTPDLKGHVDGLLGLYDGNL